VQAVEFELVGQSISKGSDQGAVVTTTVKAGDHEESYELLLEAPNGDFRQTREYAISGANVVETHSWWSAWVGCLSRSCASACLNALWACTGTWTAYFWCSCPLGCVLVRGVFHVHAVGGAAGPQGAVTMAIVCGSNTGGR
jgi:hypothetical protein